MGRGTIDWSKKYDENAGETVKCPHCDKELVNHPRSVGAHIGYWHKDKVDRTKPAFTMACKECNRLVANSANVLGRHIRAEHGLEWHDYLVKHEHNGVWPKCKCGCGEDVAAAKGNDGFRDFVKGHDSRGELNPMYGKKGSDNPNFGKVRTVEMRKQYRIASVIRHQNPALKERLRTRTFERNGKGEFYTGAGVQRSSMVNPYNGLTESLDSSWEKRFLEKQIEAGIHCVKSHDIRIQYYSPKTDRMHSYMPDFLVEGKRIVEIKGRSDAMDIMKFAYAIKWCRENGYEYSVLTYHTASDVFEDFDVENFCKNVTQHLVRLFPSFAT